MKESDGWDWEVIKYAGTVILGKSEQEFWYSTPREICALMAVHNEVNNPKKNDDWNTPTGYIDQTGI
jgi:hypothetical protein